MAVFLYLDDANISCPAKTRLASLIRPMLVAAGTHHTGDHVEKRDPCSTYNSCRKWLISTFYLMLLGLASLQTVSAEPSTVDIYLPSHAQKTSDIKLSEGIQSLTGTISILAFGDVAECKPVDWLGYMKHYLNYLFQSDMFFYGVAEGALETYKLAAKFPDADILTLGDLAYPTGSLLSYKHCFEKYFGTMLDRFYPVPGNHDYKKTQAEGYFEYWGKRAGARGKGYYSMDRGAWKIVALNSEIDAGLRSEQEKWLNSILSKTSKRCILAYYHRPVFTSRNRGGNRTPHDLFRILYDHGVSLVLNGHNHFYERTSALDPYGSKAPGRGIRTFVVGTGGRDMSYASSPASFTEALITKNWGAALSPISSF